MQNNIVCTILIPTYNRKVLVQRAITSVLSQVGIANCEIIVIDDGSIDGTNDIIQSIPGIISIIFPENRGLAHARNAGIERSSGRWIVFLDSDNYLLPGGLKKLYDVILSLEGNDSVGIIWAGNVDDSGRQMVIHSRTGIFAGEEIYRETFRGENFSLVRSDLVRNHPFPTICRRHACEPLFWFTLASKTNLLVTNEVVAFYETKGNDRFCSLAVRLSRADDMAVCYAGIIDRVGPDILHACAPVYWRLHAKLAFYQSVAGNWIGSMRAAFRSLRGLRHCPRNLGIFVLVIIGPWLSRLIVRLRG
jgi:glycosyltransferase involved in cell wall biosynthesis